MEQATPRSYFVVVGLTPEAGVQSPNVFQVTHLTESGSTAEDAEHDLLLSLEFVPNVVSKTVQVVCGISLTTGHTGDGVDPIATPTNSPSCAPGTYHPSTSISVGAQADWSGTDDDSSVELLPSCS